MRLPCSAHWPFCSRSPLTIPLAGSFMTDILWLLHVLYFAIGRTPCSEAITISFSCKRVTCFCRLLCGTVSRFPIARSCAAHHPHYCDVDGCCYLQEALLVSSRGARQWIALFCVDPDPYRTGSRRSQTFQYEALDLSSTFTVHAVINFIRYVLTCFLFSLPFFCAVLEVSAPGSQEVEADCSRCRHYGNCWIRTLGDHATSATGIHRNRPFR